MQEVLCTAIVDCCLMSVHMILATWDMTIVLNLTHHL